MNHIKISLLIMGIFSFSHSFSQTVEQDFSALDKNKDGKVDKFEFQNPPPPPPAPKKKTDASVHKSSNKIESTNDDDERAVEKEKAFEAEKMDHPTFESIDTNRDGIIDMNEFKLNHSVIRKRPGATRKTQ